MFTYIAENPMYILEKLGEHVVLFLIAWALAVVVGMSLGIFVTRPKFKNLGRTVLSVTGAAQSVPSLAIIALVFLFVGIGTAPAVIALFLYSLVPVVFNTASGLLSVSPGLKEASRGMGMTDRQILYKVELPVSLAPIASGVRSAATIAIGTATIASAIGAGGLGEIIFIGLRNMRETMIFAGALPTALLAIVVDTILALVENEITPDGLKTAE